MSSLPTQTVSVRLHDLRRSLGRLASICENKELLFEIISCGCLVDKMKTIEPKKVDDHTLTGLEAFVKSVEVIELPRIHMEGLVSFRKYEDEGSSDGLQNAVTSWQLLVSRTPDAHPGKPNALTCLGCALKERFKLLGEVTDLEDAISSQRLAVSFTLEGHEDMPAHLGNLGQALETRFSRLGKPVDLEEAISKMRLAVSLVPDEHPERPSHLENLGNALERRFDLYSEPTDLEDAISKKRLAVSLTSNRDQGRPSHLTNLGNVLQTRFEFLGEVADLQEAISSHRLAVSLTPERHSNKPGRLSNLGKALRTRFDRLGALADLEEAISFQRLAVSLTLDNHTGRPTLLSNLGNALDTRFDRLGELPDLEDAISSHRLTVSLIPDEHPDKPGYLGNLGNALGKRFDRLGELADLDDAISTRRRAVSLIPSEHKDRLVHLNNLGNALEARFHRTGRLVELVDAISTKREALALTPDRHPGRPGFLSNLANSLQTHSIELCKLSDPNDATSAKHLADSVIDEAVSIQRLAISLTSDDHPEKLDRLTNLGSALETRFNQRGEPTDLEEAISNQHLAVSLTPDGQPNKSARLFNLGKALKTRFIQYRDYNDIKNALLWTKESALLTTGPSSIRLQGALSWAHCCYLMSASLLPAFSCAVSLLPRVAWFGLAVIDQYNLLAEVSQTTGDAVAAAISEEELETAVEWAEQGRSIVWQNLFGLRSSQDTLLDQHPELSKHVMRLQEVSQELDQPAQAQVLSDGSQAKHPIDNRMRLAMERDRLIDTVRSTPGLEHFMKPKSFEHIAPAGQGGPIVILNLGHRCDALVLLPDDSGKGHVANIPLERVTAQKAQELSAAFMDLLGRVGIRRGEFRKSQVKGAKEDTTPCFKEILRILWTDYVQPVIEGLAFGLADGKPPRLWWCTTGVLAFLPLHAAGDYDTSEVGHKLSDYVVSSYTPSIATLLNQSPRTPSQLPKIFTVAISNTPGNPLPSTKREVEAVHRLAAHLPTVGLKNQEATKDRVLEELKRCNWAHLACHGQQVGGDAMSSKLMLHGGMLELSEIAKTQFPNGDFVFLSACETAVGDKGVPDESAHLAAGMLFAGFRGVVGTMWAIKDDIAPFVAEETYRYMLRDGKADGEQAVYGLHAAVRSLQERGERFEEWLPFIHIGR